MFYLCCGKSHPGGILRDSSTSTAINLSHRSSRSSISAITCDSFSNCLSLTCIPAGVGWASAAMCMGAMEMSPLLTVLSRPWWSTSVRKLINFLPFASNSVVLSPATCSYRSQSL